MDTTTIENPHPLPKNEMKENEFFFIFSLSTNTPHHITSLTPPTTTTSQHNHNAHIVRSPPQIN
jgi:hypothetical protein